MPGGEFWDHTHNSAAPPSWGFVSGPTPLPPSTGPPTCICICIPKGEIRTSTTPELLTVRANFEINFGFHPLPRCGLGPGCPAGQAPAQQSLQRCSAPWRRTSGSFRACSSRSEHPARGPRERVQRAASKGPGASSLFCKLKLDVCPVQRASAPAAAIWGPRARASRLQFLHLETSQRATSTPLPAVLTSTEPDHCQHSSSQVRRYQDAVRRVIAAMPGRLGAWDSSRAVDLERPVASSAGSWSQVTSLEWVFPRCPRPCRTCACCSRPLAAAAATTAPWAARYA